MGIIHITGPQGAGKTTHANALRNAQIGSGKGALIVDHEPGEPQHMLEKIIAGDTLTEKTKAKDINWKPDPLIVFVGDAIDQLDLYEALAPGFTKMFGPVKQIALG